MMDWSKRREGCSPVRRGSRLVLILAYALLTAGVVSAADATFMFKLGLVLNAAASGPDAAAQLAAGCAAAGSRAQAMAGLGFLRRQNMLLTLTDVTGRDYSLDYDVSSMEAANCTSAGRARIVDELYASGTHFAFSTQASGALQESSAAGRLGRILYHCCLEDMDTQEVRNFLLMRFAGFAEQFGRAKAS